MLRSTFALIAVVCLNSASAQNTPPAKTPPPIVISRVPVPGAPSTSILGASAEYLRGEYSKSFPAIMLVVSPTVLAPPESSLPRVDKFGEPIGAPHAKAMLAGVAHAREIVVATRLEALDCKAPKAICLRSNQYLGVAFGIPKVIGDTAFVNATSLLALAPDPKGVDYQAKSGSVGTTELYLQLFREKGKWRVIGRKVIARR